MTYQELYLQHLESSLSNGGAQDAVEDAIKEFNRPTSEGFEAWIKEVTLALCSTCGDLFKPENVKPEMETLCTTHAPKPA